MRFTVESYITINGKTPFIDAFKEIKSKSVKLADKVELNIELLTNSEHHELPHCKLIEKGIYTLRVKQSRHLARIFFHKDSNATVWLLNGFYKTTDKIPDNHLSKARHLLAELKDRGKHVK